MLNIFLIGRIAMISLSLTTESQASLPSLTPGPGSPVKALRYRPQPGDGSTVEEDIDLVLEGSPAEIQAFLTDLSQALERAAIPGAAIPGSDIVYLVAMPTPGADPWQSPLLQARLLPGPTGVDQRAAGVQPVRIHLTRADYWEEPSDRPVPFQTPLRATPVTGPLVLANAADASRTNQVNLPARQLSAGLPLTLLGDLPAPLHLSVGLVAANTRPVAFWVGECARANADQLSSCYPAESGSARGSAVGTVVSDSTCANGAYLNVLFTGAADQEIFAVTLPGADVSAFGGGAVRPVLRLQDGLPAAEKFWYRWKLYALRAGVESLVAETPAQYFETLQELIPGPAMALPPWVVPQNSPALPDLRLALALSAATTDSHTLKIDSVYLMGLDGWRRYAPLNNDPDSGFTDISRRGLLFAYADYTQSHTAEGPGLWLYPGQDHRFWFFAQRYDSAEKAAPIDLAQRVEFFYRARRRCL
jgi:hypothetical protein